MYIVSAGKIGMRAKSLLSKQVIIVIVRRQLARYRYRPDTVADAILLQYVIQVRGERQDVESVIAAGCAQVLVDKNKV